MNNKEKEMIYNFYCATIDEISKTHRAAILDRETQYTHEQKAALTYEYCKTLETIEKVFKEFIQA